MIIIKNHNHNNHNNNNTNTVQQKHHHDDRVHQVRQYDQDDAATRIPARDPEDAV